MDGAHNIITDSFVTSASVADSTVYLQRLDRVCRRFALQPEAVGLDAGYNTVEVCRGLVQRNISGVVGYKRPSGPRGIISKRQFAYDPGSDSYLCPQGRRLSYSSTSRTGNNIYRSKRSECALCSVRSRCISGKGGVRSVNRHVWQDYKETVDGNRLTPWGKVFYRGRQQTVESSFADARELHGHRYARMRGLDKVSEQCLLAQACQNMKKIALTLWKKGPAGPLTGLYWCLRALLPSRSARYQLLAAQDRLKGKQQTKKVWLSAVCIKLGMPKGPSHFIHGL